MYLHKLLTLMMFLSVPAVASADEPVAGRPRSADERAALLAEKYIAKVKKPKVFAAYDELRRKADAYRARGNYRKAQLYYLYAMGWLPSAHLELKHADAYFLSYAHGNRFHDPETGAPVPCLYGKAFVRAAHLQLESNWQYEVAFKLDALVKTRPAVPRRELERGLRKAACLRALTASYAGRPTACVDQGAIARCLAVK